MSTIEEIKTTTNPAPKVICSDKGSELTGSQAVLEACLIEGVDTIFGYPGGAIMPIYDALYDYNDKLKHILVRHEQGGIHAAQGYARASGRVGVVFATSGPGATNLVTGLPRTITVKLSNKINASVYGPVLDEVVRRYNAENLTITLTRVSSASAADITFDNANGSYLASAGFPTAGGDPYNLVKVNTRAIGSGTSTTFINYAATIFAHELGHCIGFRHTDYMDRSYSCGGSVSNEGASTVGAILIPGTPAAADPNSFMLACIGSGVNRPFNANDRTALNYLY